MENFKLKALGVEGLNGAEMSETNGGIIGAILTGFAIYLAWDVAMNPSDAASAFSEGMNDRMNMR